MKLKLEAWLNKIIQYVRSNNFGTRTSLTLNVEFVCPCDGYIFCTCASTYNAQAMARIASADGSSYLRIGGAGNSTYGNWSLFVKKGMKVTPEWLANGGAITFIPIVGGTP